MELRLLKYFLTVAREETMTNAAKVLHITQPTLSRQIARMEEDLGTKLFSHDGRKLILTNDGLLLRRRAEDILSLVDKTERELSCHDEKLTGTIVIGHGEIKAMEVLADDLAPFSREYPYVRFHFFTATADIVRERMERGLIDIGLMLEPVSMENYEYIRMNITEKNVVWMRPDDELARYDKIKPEYLADKPLIVPVRYRESTIDWLGSYYREENLRFIATLPAMGAVLVSKGLGYMISIRSALPFCDPSKIVERPMAGKQDLSSVLAWRRGQPTSHAVKRFIEYIKRSSSMKQLCETSAGQGE